MIYKQQITKTGIMEIKNKSKRLLILEQSLLNKQAKFDQKLDAHIKDVKSANGQPLNDKRNGQVTLNRWERQNEALNTLEKSIQKTKEAIDLEKGKILEVEYSVNYLPSALLEAVDSGEIIQWRKHPTFFFVKGVERARLHWDTKKKELLVRYHRQIPNQEQYTKFRDTFIKLRDQLERVESVELKITLKSK